MRNADAIARYRLSGMLAQATSGDVAIVYIVAIATVVGAVVAGIYLFRRR